MRTSPARSAPFAAAAVGSATVTPVCGHEDRRPVAVIAGQVAAERRGQCDVRGRPLALIATKVSGSGSTTESPVSPSKATIVPSGIDRTSATGADDGRDPARPGEDRAVRGRAARMRAPRRPPRSPSSAAAWPASGRRRPARRRAGRSRRPTRRGPAAPGPAARAHVGRAGPQVLVRRVWSNLRLGDRRGPLTTLAAAVPSSIDSAHVIEELGVVEQHEVRVEDAGLRRPIRLEQACSGRTVSRRTAATAPRSRATR